MPSKKYSVEQIVSKLREAERLQGQGLTIAQLCKRLGIHLDPV
jgi:putative transposase